MDSKVSQWEKDLFKLRNKLSEWEKDFKLSDNKDMEKDLFKLMNNLSQWEKDFFKLMNTSVFRKLAEDIVLNATKTKEPCAISRC